MPQLRANLSEHAAPVCKVNFGLSAPVRKSIGDCRTCAPIYPTTPRLRTNQYAYLGENTAKVRNISIGVPGPVCKSIPECGTRAQIYRSTPHVCANQQITPRLCAHIGQQPASQSKAEALQKHATECRTHAQTCQRTAPAHAHIPTTCQNQAKHKPNQARRMPEHVRTAETVALVRTRSYRKGGQRVNFVFTSSESQV